MRNSLFSNFLKSILPSSSLRIDGLFYVAN
jgi:hypothetical protein